MLVLSRKVGERIVIDDRITIVVNRISGNRVTIGIEAPDSVRIVRGELQPIVESFEAPEEGEESEPEEVKPNGPAGLPIEYPLGGYLPPHAPR